MSDTMQFPPAGLLWTRPVDPSERDARAQRLVERRIEVYRRRAAAIVARFGADVRLPADVNVFDPDADERNARASA